MAEWLENPSVLEAVDVIACLVFWSTKVGYNTDQLLALMEERLAVWRERKWEQQPNGTFHHVKDES
jgi:hypothetical protein